MGEIFQVVSAPGDLGDVHIRAVWVPPSLIDAVDRRRGRGMDCEVPNITEKSDKYLQNSI